MAATDCGEELVGEWRYEGRQVFVFRDDRRAFRALFAATKVRIHHLSVVWFGVKVSDAVPYWVHAAWENAEGPH